MALCNYDRFQIFNCPAENIINNYIIVPAGLPDLFLGIGNSFLNHFRSIGITPFKSAPQLLETWRKDENIDPGNLLFLKLCSPLTVNVKYQVYSVSRHCCRVFKEVP